MDKFDFLSRRINSIIDIVKKPESFEISRILNLAELILQNILLDRRVAFVGNGGSAAEAMHLAAEFTGKCVIDHPPFPVICLNESQSALTAIANDYGVEQMFARQVAAHLRKDDLLIALSTSGKSPNITKALNTASTLGVKTVLWMGDFETNLLEVDVWKVPSKDTPRIQEIHLAWGHIISELVEQAWLLEK